MTETMELLRTIIISYGECSCLGSLLRRKRLDKPKRAPPQIKRLNTKLRNLASKLAESVPKTELESLKSALESNVRDLEARLAKSIPKAEAESLKEKAAGLESRLVKAERELDASRLRIKELETAQTKPPAEKPSEPTLT
jgi:chromosome segregation ATPase